MMGDDSGLRVKILPIVHRSHRYHRSPNICTVGPGAVTPPRLLPCVCLPMKN